MLRIPTFPVPGSRYLLSVLVGLTAACPSTVSQAPSERGRFTSDDESPAAAKLADYLELAKAKPRGEDPRALDNARLHQGVAKVLDGFVGHALVLVVAFDSGKVLAQSRRFAESGAQLEKNGVLPPASTVKPLLAWQALASGKWSADKLVNCHGTTPDADGNYCFHRHGEIDLATAIATSCNAYFFPLAAELGREGLVQAFTLAGFDGASVPEQNWQATALGHGAVEVTPQQLAEAYRKLGWALAADAELAPIRLGLERAVADPMGSAHAAATSSVALLGKTGTAQAVEPEYGKYLSWFVGLAPANKPEVVILAWTQANETAGEAAVPLATKLVAAWHEAR